MTTAADALEEVLAQIAAVDGLSGMDRLEARLDSANAARNFIMKHAATLRAALAAPQAGEVEELARRFEAYADDADQHGLFLLPIAAETLRHAVRLLRTKSNGRSPENPATGRLQHRPDVACNTGSEPGSAGCGATGGQIDGESPAPSAPAQPVAWANEGLMEVLNNAGEVPIILNSTKRWPSQIPLYAAPQPDEAVALLREVVRRYDDYRGKGMLPAPGEYQMVVGAIERIRAFLTVETANAAALAEVVKAANAEAARTGETK